MIRILLMAMGLSFLPVANGADDTGADAARTRIAERFPGVDIDDIRPSPIPGLYEVMVGPLVIYASKDGRYLIKGDIYDLETDSNLTAARIDDARSQALYRLSDNDLIVFGESDAPYTVTVFTDVDCTYCRTLHSQIGEYEKRGIRVRYAAYPRNGLTSKSWQAMEDVWCAADRRRALTLAKQDREFETRDCDTDQVANQWQLGRLLGVRGTPAIFTESGRMIPGYLPPDQLLNQLKAEVTGQ